MKMKAGLVTFFGSGKAQSINLEVPTYTHNTEKGKKKIQSKSNAFSNRNVLCIITKALQQCMYKNLSLF